MKFRLSYLILVHRSYSLSSRFKFCFFSSFFPELERVKKQYKSYSDEKERELHSLVKRIRELENNLRSSTSGENSSLYAVPEGVIASFESDADIENLSLFKAPGSLVDEKGKRVMMRMMMMVNVVLLVIVVMSLVLLLR